MFTSIVTARDALECVARDFDASVLDGDEARRTIAELGLIRRLTDGMLAKTAKRVSDTATSSEQNGAMYVARSLGVSNAEVRASINTAAQLESLPGTDAAVRAGKLSPGQTRMIAETASKNPDAEIELLAAADLGLVPLRDACIAARARAEDPEARAKRHKEQRGLRIWAEPDGMVAGRFRLTPEVGGQIKAAVDGEVQRIFRLDKGTDHEPHDAYAADALAELVLGGNEVATGTKGAKGAKATVHIVIDHGALMRGGTADGEVCEIPGVGPVDVNWVRELIGSAFLTAIIKRGKDILTVAHLGRHIPAELQTALIVSGRECQREGCFNRGYLERDHAHDHAKGGPTSFENLGWLCSRDHYLKSRGWILGPPDPKTRKCVLRPPPVDEK